EALFEQGSGEPYRRRERRQRGGEEDQDQPVAKAIHPFLPWKTVRGKSASRNGPCCNVHEGFSGVDFRLRNSTTPRRLIPVSPSMLAVSFCVAARSSKRSQNGRCGASPSALIARFSIAQASACAAVECIVVRAVPGMVTANFSSHRA